MENAKNNSLDIFTQMKKDCERKIINSLGEFGELLTLINKTRQYEGMGYKSFDDFINDCRPAAAIARFAYEMYQTHAVIVKHIKRV